MQYQQHSPPRFVLPCAFVVGQNASRGVAGATWITRSDSAARADKTNGERVCAAGQSVPWEPGVRMHTYVHTNIEVGRKGTPEVER